MRCWIEKRLSVKCFWCCTQELQNCILISPLLLCTRCSYWRVYEWTVLIAESFLLKKKGKKTPQAYNPRRRKHVGPGNAYIFIHYEGHNVLKPNEMHTPAQSLEISFWKWFENAEIKYIASFWFSGEAEKGTYLLFLTICPLVSHQLFQERKLLLI